MGTPTTAATEKHPLPALPLTRNPRFFLLPGNRAPTAVEEEPDGTRHLLLQGMRLTIQPDDSIRRGEELLPYSNVEAIPLPPRLGKGYLFHAASGGDTLLWRADSWTSKLVPLARFGFVTQRIVPGFDTLLLHVKGSQEVVAVNVQDGKAEEARGLPVAPGVRHLAFADPWMGVVDVPIRGTLATFDAGTTWHSLGLGPSHFLAEKDGLVVIRRDDHDYTLDATGRLLQLKVRFNESEPTATEVDAHQKTVGPLGKHPLRTAVLHGWPDSNETAVVAAHGNLARVRLSDGKILDVTKKALATSDDCHGVPLGGGFGFVCGSEDQGTVIHAFEPPLNLRPILRFELPRYVASSGNGALVLRGGCESGAANDTTRYCVITARGVLREIRVRGDSGVERLVALHDGRTAVIVPPRFGAKGQITIVSASGEMKSVKMRLPKESAERSMVRKGLWLDGFVETPKGELAGWVAAGGPFVGIRVALDGKIKVGAIENEVERALLSGRVGLVLGRSGLAAETTDGGFTWREVDLPVDVTTSTSRTAEQGCSRVGCVHGNWVRIGWRGRKGKHDVLAEAAAPRATVLDNANRGGRWLLECAPTTETQIPHVAANTSPPRTPVPPIPPRWHHGHYGAMVLTADTVQSSAWSPFQGVAPPRLGKDDVGFDHTPHYLDNRVHAYAWGARTADWGRFGNWMIRGGDEFAFENAVWSTATTRSPWPDSVAAAQAFGQNVYGSPSPSWTLATEPSGRGGLLFITQNTGPELYLFEANRSIVKVRGAAGLGVHSAAGVVKVEGRWYLGTYRETFRIYAVVGDEIELLGDYPLLASDASRTAVGATVVRNDAGDALGIWVRTNRTRGSESDWFVYPIDTQTGEVSEPLLLDRGDLSHPPEACTSADTGWELVGTPPISPFVDLVENRTGISMPRNVKARLIAGAHGLCADAYNAYIDTPIPARPPPTPTAWERNRHTVPMIVSHHGQPGARWKLRCAH